LSVSSHGSKVRRWKSENLGLKKFTRERRSEYRGKRTEHREEVRVQKSADEGKRTEVRERKRESVDKRTGARERRTETERTSMDFRELEAGELCSENGSKRMEVR
jgi:hypothetical protein